MFANSDVAAQYSPSGLNAYSTNSTSIFLQWNHGSSGAPSYRVQRRLPDSDWYEVAELDGSTTSYVDNRVLCNQEYDYRIVAMEPGVMVGEVFGESETVSAYTDCNQMLQVNAMVGGDGLCDETHCSLGEAIDAANMSDPSEMTLIYLPAGSYYVGTLPRFEVNIGFIGEDAETTIIETEELNFYADAEIVLLKNLTIRSSDSRPITSASARLFAMYNVQLELDLTYFPLRRSGNEGLVEIRHSVFRGREANYGMDFGGSANHYIFEGNSFGQNQLGSLMEFSGSENRILLRNNTFDNNITHTSRPLIRISGPYSQLMLEHNTFYNNQHNFIDFSSSSLYPINFWYQGNIFADGGDCDFGDSLFYSLGGNLMQSSNCPQGPDDFSSSAEFGEYPEAVEISASGSTTWVYPLGSASQAQDTTSCDLRFDQTGRARPVNELCDSGAVEKTAEYEWPLNFVSEFSNSRVNLSWTDVVEGETAYLLERSEDGENWLEIAELTADSASHADTDIVCDGAYSYRIRAYYGDSDTYGYYAYTWGQFTPCSVQPPTAVFTEGEAIDFARLRWTDNADNESAYLVERSTDGGTSWTEISELPADSIVYSDDPLPCNSNYWYRVRAYSEADGAYSVYSPVVQINTLPCVELPESSICTLRRMEADFPLDVYEAVISGDGSRVAALIINQGDASIVLMDSTSDEILAIIPDTALGYSLSDDGQTIAFVSDANHAGNNADGNYEIFLWHNGVYTQITNTSTSSFYHHLLYLSGDGSTILFVSEIDLFTQIDTGDNFHLYIWKQGQGLSFLVPEPTVATWMVNTNMALSDDGNSVIFFHQGNLTGNDPNQEGMFYRKDLSSGIVTAVAGPEYNNITNIRVNDDASRIVASRTMETGVYPTSYLYTELLLWDAESGWQQITNLSSPHSSEVFASMDASGERILFGATHDLTGENPIHANNDVIENEYFIYEELRGFSQLSNHNTAWLLLLNSSLSDDGTRAVLMLSSSEVQQLSFYFRPYVATCLPVGTVNAPDGLTGNFTADSIHLNWNDNADNESQYSLQYSVDGLSWQDLATLPADSESYTHSSLVCDVNYEYRIRAYSSTLELNSHFSNVATVTSPSCDLTQPGNMGVTAFGLDSISLAWGDGNNETAYLLERSLNGTNWQQIASLAANTTNYTDTGLNCSTNYQYRLRSFDSLGNHYSFYTPTLSQSTASCPSLGTSTLSISNSGDFGLSLSWTAADHADTYEIYEVGANSALSLLTSVSAETSSYDIAGLSCYSNKTYTLMARREDDNASSRSNDVNFVVTVCPLAPTNLVASPSATSIALSWQDKANNETSYQLQRRIGTGSWTDVGSIAANSTSYTDTELDCQTSYAYRLRANGAEEAHASGWLTVNSTTTTCPPLIPSVLSVSSATESSINLAWTVDTTATRFSLWTKRGASWTNLGNFTESTANFTHANLQCASNYQYRVQTYRQQDNTTAYSTVFIASTASCGPLAAPSAPIVLNTETSIVSLQIPNKPAGSGGLQLERSLDGTIWQSLGLVSGYYLDTTVICATSYQYRLIALRGNDSSEPSPLANATTDACPTPMLSVVGVYKDGRWVFSDEDGNSSEISFGAGAGYQALTGDWDGDGEDGLALYKDGVFIFRETLNSTEESRVPFGSGTGWQALVGDWNGDGIDSVGIYKDGIFILSDDNLQMQYRFNFVGGTGWQAISGDWDGNGADSVGLYRRGNWRLTNSLTTPEVSHNFVFGPDTPDWIALVGDWNGDGTDGIGLYLRGYWRLRETVESAENERIFNFGAQVAGWWPIASSPYVPNTPPDDLPTVENDDDADGLSNGDENLLHLTDPQNSDTDGDGLGDGHEVILHETNPLLSDTDSDGLSDGDELNTHSTDALDSDSDDDGLNDGEEISLYASNPNNVNSDNDSCVGLDGLSHSLDDYFEVKGVQAIGYEDADSDTVYNSMEADADADTLEDCVEVHYYGTNPYQMDTDADGMADNDELAMICRDPKNPGDAGVSVCANIPPVANFNYSCTLLACNFSSTASDVDGTVASYAWDFDNNGTSDNTTANPAYSFASAGSYAVSLTVTDNSGDSHSITKNLSVSNNAAPVAHISFNCLNLACDFSGSSSSDADGTITAYSWNFGNGGGISTGVNVSHSYNAAGSYTVTLTITDNEGATATTSRTVVVTMPSDGDDDDDSLPDVWEVANYNYPHLYNGTDDPDADGCNNLCEYTNGLYPTLADTDGDGLTDGEELGIGTSPAMSDTDSDGLNDLTEVLGISNYGMTIDGVSVTVTLLGLNPLNPDTDADALTDGDEVNVYGTHPLDMDTDDDGLLDSLDPDPLTTDSGSIDEDGDGISNEDEENAIPPTDPYAFDSDGDGMGDGDESITNINISATGYNLTTNQTYSINIVNESLFLDTSYEDADGDTVADGYDSDKDGLSDAFELYWYRPTAYILGIHPMFTAFSGVNESCLYGLTGSQPLHPDDPDTDNDGLLDGDECNVYMTNPFSAELEGPIFEKVTEFSFLNSIVYPALEGDVVLASVYARSLNYTVGSSDGLITVRVVRAFDPVITTRRQLLGSLITSSCGATAYTNASMVTTIFTNSCGRFAGGIEPNGNNNDEMSPVLVQIPMSQFFTVLRDSRIVSMSPVSN